MVGSGSLSNDNSGTVAGGPGQEKRNRRGAAVEQNATVLQIEKILDRIEQVVEEETLLLKMRRVVDLREFNHRKSQALFELSRLGRAMALDFADRNLIERLRRLQTKLDENQAMLRMHVEAVREIANMVAKSIQQAESDGTYSPAMRRTNGTGTR